MKELMIGDSHQFLVAAAEPWNASGLRLTPDEAYHLAVIETSDWRDDKLATTADGFTRWDLTPVDSVLRVPSEKWFCLIGAISPNLDHFFRIGSRLNRFVPPSGGELYCFANDVPGLYDNNYGQLTLRVTRIQ